MLNEMFYQPKTKELLEPSLAKANISWGMYQRHPLESIAQAENILRPTFNPTEKLKDRRADIVRLTELLEPDQVLVIPYDSGAFPQVSARRLQHKGEVVKLRRVSSIEEAVKERITPNKLIKEAFAGVNLSHNYVGYDWKSIKDETYNIVTLLDCIRGYLMANQTEESLRVKEYDSCHQVELQGGKGTVFVPSVDKEHVNGYDVTMEHLPEFNAESGNLNYYAQWFELSSPHECKRRTYAFHYGRKGPVNDWGVLPERRGKELVHDHHMIAAYHRLKRYKAEKNNGVHIPINPYVCPTDETLKYFQNLSHVLKEVPTDDGIRRVPLNDVDKEIMLWYKKGKENEKAYSSTSASSGL